MKRQGSLEIAPLIGRSRAPPPHASRRGEVVSALCIIVAAFATLAASAAFPADPDPLVEAGRRIYQEGVLPSGKQVHAARDGGTQVSGANAACMLCHRRSGMGAPEGLTRVPPVIGRALFDDFRRIGQMPQQASGARSPPDEFRLFGWAAGTRPPYDDSTLARAIREGVSTSGSRFQYLMPRYDLGDADMAALIAYLKSLSVDASPGARTPTVKFATVIAPAMDGAKRDAFLGVLRACMGIPRLRSRHDRGGTWQLQEWQLEGPAETWSSQLRERYAREPVFAIVSGLGGAQWAPVHQFCESERVPCLFPNVEMPGDTEDAIYSFYFSRGVLLEADALAAYLAEHRERLGIKGVLQLSADEAGSAAAAALRRALVPYGIETRDRNEALPGAAAAAVSWLQQASSKDAIVLWLRAGAIEALMRRLSVPPGSQPVFFSGLLGGLEHTPVPAAWRPVSYLTYPEEIPGRWKQRVHSNLLPWLTSQGLTSRDERLEGNTLAACASLSESVYGLMGVYRREYLLETVENALSNSGLGNAGATAAFPRFLLGTNQRFASKGSYIVRFAGPSGTGLAGESDWIVP